MTKINKATNKVISPSRLGDYKTPYILEFSENNDYQKIILIGINHTNNPLDEQLKIINNLFDKWQKETKDKERVIVTERSVELLEKNGKLEEDIKELGEIGLLLYLAKNNNIENIVCPEPTWEDLILSLKSEYKVNDILLWVFLSFLIYRFKENKKITKDDIEDTKKEIRETAKKFRKDIKIEKIFTYFKEKIEEIADKKLLPSKIDELVDITKENIDSLFDIQKTFSNKNENVISKISESINWNRDKFIASELLNIMDNGVSIFQVYGSNHVVAQEPVYVEYFENKK